LQGLDVSETTGLRIPLRRKTPRGYLTQKWLGPKVGLTSGSLKLEFRTRGHTAMGTTNGDTNITPEYPNIIQEPSGMGRATAQRAKDERSTWLGTIEETYQQGVSHVVGTPKRGQMPPSTSRRDKLDKVRETSTENQGNTIAAGSPSASALPLIAIGRQRTNPAHGGEDQGKHTRTGATQQRPVSYATTDRQVTVTREESKQRQNRTGQTTDEEEQRTEQQTD